MKEGTLMQKILLLPHWEMEFGGRMPSIFQNNRIIILKK